MTMKKIVIAPDSFKGSMSARMVADAVERGLRRILGNTCHYTIIPMADGGEGTVAALEFAHQAQRVTTQTVDPIQRPIHATYAISSDGNTAIIEMAEASGLQLLTEDERDPRYTSTYGTGRLLRDALDRGVSKIILGIGGSATNDGGAGLFEALGVQFLNHQQQPIQRGGIYLNDLATLDCTHIHPRLKDVTLHVACDVSNPLLGPSGASAIYGPQKGATADIVALLDDALAHYHTILERTTHRDVQRIPGSGAAGGTGAALLAFTDAKLQPGIDIVLNETAFSKHVAHADLVITGEGALDAQTSYGKTPIGVARAAKQYHVPVIAITGKLAPGYETVYHHGIDAIFPITPGPIPIKEALCDAPLHVERTAENIARLIKLEL